MTFVHTRNSLASSDKIWTQHTPIAYNITSIYLARAVYTMKTSAISSRYLARGSFDGSLNLTCFPRSPRIVLHGSAPQTDPSRSRHSGSHEIACEARKWRPSTRSQIATPIFLRRLRYGVASLSLSLFCLSFFLYFFPPTIRPRFERNVHEQVHAIYRVFIAAVTRVAPCNFV